MIINIIDEQASLNISPSAVQQVVKQVLKGEKEKCDEVSVYFVNTSKICELHAQFFDDPSTTDCISFPMDEDDDLGYRLLGEIFVCPETAILYAQEHHTDPLEETTLYVVHGILHLIGYDDIEDADREEMRKAELRHMTRLKQLDLILKN